MKHKFLEMTSNWERNILAKNKFNFFFNWHEKFAETVENLKHDEAQQLHAF